MKTPADSASLPFGTRAQLASAAAWSPNPKNPPLYLDLPIKDGESQPDILAKWAANGPLAFADRIVTVPIDERIYGQFLEHINHLVEDGLFAEQIPGAGFEGEDFKTY